MCQTLKDSHVRLSTIFTDLPSFIYGQAGQDLPQFVIPFKFLFGYNSGGATGGGTFDLMRKFRTFVWCLKVNWLSIQRKSQSTSCECSPNLSLSQKKKEGRSMLTELHDEDGGWRM